MAEASISVDQFICRVCLDLLKDPVAIPCGHSFCKRCIHDFWDQDEKNRVYCCPQCGDTFTPRPVLRRNSMLAEVVEKRKKTEEVQAASPAHCSGGPGDVECDFCTGRKRKAIKSCLMCVASLCETHLKPHLEVPALKKHKLAEASGNLQEKICSQHDEVLKIYCRTDQSFICYVCVMHEHKNHDTVSVKAYRSGKQSELKEEQMKSQQRLQEKQKKVQELKQAVNTIKRSAQTAVEDSERIFIELISSMEKKRWEVTELIRDQEKAELSRAERQLEQEIADLQRRVTELEQLSHTHDHIHFLQSFQCLCVSSGREDSPSITVNQHLSFDGVRKSLSDLKKRLEEFCQEELIKIPEHVEHVQTLPSEPTVRNEFLKLEDDQILLSEPTIKNEFLKLEDNQILPSEPTVRNEFLKLEDDQILPSEPTVRNEFLKLTAPNLSPSLGKTDTHTAEDDQILLSRPTVKNEFLKPEDDQILLSRPTVKNEFLKLEDNQILPSEPTVRNEFLKLEDDQLLPSEPKSRDDFLKYFCDLTLDPNTVNYYLILSEKNRVVECSEREQPYSDHPERFDSWFQVLCQESLCGRCYWEVEWRSKNYVYISVSYKDIRRKGWGDKCVFGRNNQSWSLWCSSSSSSLSFCHNNIKTVLRVPSPSRIGVYVDHGAGTLSFYNVSDTMKLLHSVHTTFTQPLYAGFWLDWCESGSTVRLCDLKKS